MGMRLEGYLGFQGFNARRRPPFGGAVARRDPDLPHQRQPSKVQIHSSRVTQNMMKAIDLVGLS
jgi:hypothetical protein